MNAPTDRYENCSICDKPFTEKEWEDRHTSANGEDCHEDCCDMCAMEDADDLEAQFDALLGGNEQPQRLIAVGRCENGGAFTVISVKHTIVSPALIGK